MSTRHRGLALTRFRGNTCYRDGIPLRAWRELPFPSAPPMPTDPQIIAAERKSLMGLLSNVPLRSVDENVVIASWNIAQFSEKKKARAPIYCGHLRAIRHCRH